MALDQTAPLSNDAPIKELGFTDDEIAQLSPNVSKLTKGDLISLMTYPDTAPAALELTLNDLRGLNGVVTARIVKTGGGGSGDGGIRCCCCIACCCCCCAVSVEQSNAIA